jgi:SAM-dependent methyltransferase
LLAARTDAGDGRSANLERVSSSPLAGTDRPLLQVPTDDWLRWAFGTVLLWRLLFPFFDSPLLHLFSDPARHWANGGRFFTPDLIGAGDPFLYQLWIYLLRTVTQDDGPTVLLGCGLLCAAMPYGWYRALRELLPRRSALIGGVIIGLIPAFVGIYAYFMTETLLLTLTGFAFWATFRSARKRTLAAYVLASALWVCAIFTRSIALPMALLCLGMLWLTQSQRLAKALCTVVAFTLLAVPAGPHLRSTLGFFSPLGNLYLSQIYSASGNHDITINAGPLGGWGFGTPSFYNPTFYPFSKWTTDRVGTAHIAIDVSRGRETWLAEKKRIESLRSFPWRRQYEENLIYLLFGQSWPDNDPNALSGLASVWTRWLWPPLMLLVAWGALRQRYRGWEWLLPVCALGMLLSLAVQRDGIIEGRYRKPIDPVLVASAIVLYYRTRAGQSAGHDNQMPSYDASFFEYVNASARAAAERIVPLLAQQLSPASVLDVGCGQGAWLAVWQQHGVDDVFGVDGSYVDRARLLFAPERFYAHDLGLPFDFGRRFGLVECLEVAEHLPEASAATLIDSLVRHGEVIVFSAAPPGQGGHDHVNERSYDYWRALFRQRGYVAADYLRPRIVADAGVDPWYRYNTLLYLSRDAVPRLPAELQASLIPDDRPVPDVSPLGYRVRKQLVRALPVRLMTALARMKERAPRRPA